MKTFVMKPFFGMALLATAALAQEIEVTPEQERSWKIETEAVRSVEAVPLGTVMVEVTTPPHLMHTLSLPFEAQVVRLQTTSYTPVKRGEVLVQVGGNGWIEAQKSVVTELIEQDQQRQISERKRALCDAEIIAQKECAAADAALQHATLRVSAAEAVLRAYGADSATVAQLERTMQVAPYLAVKAPVNATVMEVLVQPGDTVSPSKPLVTLKQEGAHWLESDMDVDLARYLKAGASVSVSAEGVTLETTVLQMAPVVAAMSQTRHVRLALPQGSALLPGLRTTATLTLPQQALKLSKQSVVRYEGADVVFTRSERGYTMQNVHVISEDPTWCYVTPGIDAPVVRNAAAVLKAMLGEAGDE